MSLPKHKADLPTMKPVLPRLRVTRPVISLMIGSGLLIVLLYHASVLQLMTRRSRSSQGQQGPVSSKVDVINPDWLALNETIASHPVSSEIHTQNIPPAVISNLYEVERERLLQEMDFSPIRTAYDVQAEQAFEPSLDRYISRLRYFVDEYFDGSDAEPQLNQMLDNLALHISPPLNRDRPMRKVVSSTAKEGWDGVDKRIFPVWEEKLGPTGWEVQVADDELTEQWFTRITRGGKGSEKWQGLWENLSAPVLKSDLIR